MKKHYNILMEAIARKCLNSTKQANELEFSLKDETG